MAYEPRHGSDEKRIRVEAQCDQCNVKITVPFQPIEGRPLLCRDCRRPRDGGLRGGSQPVERDGVYEISCSHCSKIDTIPFRPHPGSAVLCGECKQNPNIIRVGNKVLHNILCSACGKEALVPFKPDKGSRVLCKQCHNEEREQKTRMRDRFMQSHPADIHGTKVRIEVHCDSCGTIDTLNYIPKTTGAILCRQCAEKTFGEEWADKHKLKAKEYPFTCAQCHKQDFVPFKPKEDHELLCKGCLNDHAIIRQDRENIERMNKFICVRKKS